MKHKLPKSTRKHIRKEKARIRRKFINEEAQEEKIKELLLKYENKRDIQSGD